MEAAVAAAMSKHAIRGGRNRGNGGHSAHYRGGIHRGSFHQRVIFPNSSQRGRGPGGSGNRGHISSWGGNAYAHGSLGSSHFTTWFIALQ